jgi:branched-chain amino acid transport system substrate-binding protein
MPHIRVGVLIDSAGDAASANDMMTEWLRREIDLVRESGRLTADVEIVHAYGLGLPAGNVEAVRRAFDSLLEQDVLLIVGPAIGDNALIATDWMDRAKVPAINFAGAERARSEYMFHLQVGGHEDESIIIARHLKDSGVKRVGVVYDQSPIGTRHLAYLEHEARIVGLDIGATRSLSPLAENAAAEVAQVLDSKPDGFVYFGLGFSAPPVARALTDRGWQGPRIMNTAGLRGYWGDFAKACDGWIYVDMHSDHNRTLAALAEVAQPGALPFRTAVGYDMGRLVAEALARAPELTREGVKAGLEQVKWLPAAEGEEGTLLGFGVHDRGALHGRYMVLRQWRDGRSTELRPA